MAAKHTPPTTRSVDMLFTRVFDNPDIAPVKKHWDEKAADAAIEILEKALARNPLFLDAQGFIGDGDTLLVRAVDKWSVPVIGYLLKKGADPDRRTRKGRTPLMICAEYGFEPGVELLLKYGARVDLRDEHGQGALLCAVKKQMGEVSLYERLVAAGASLMEVDDKGRRPFHLLCGSADPDLETVKLLTKGLPQDVINQRLGDEGVNVFHLVNGSPDQIEPVLRHLIECGGDPLQTSWVGRTAIHSMVRDQCPGLEAFVSVGVDVNAQDAVGRTALHLACQKPGGRLDHIKTLLKQGARADIRDFGGMTPLHILEKLEPATFKDKEAVEQVIDLLQAQTALNVIDTAASQASMDLRPL